MGKEIVRGPHNRLEALQKESPEFLAMAMATLNKWKPNENYLVEVIARSLREAHAMGVAITSPPEVDQEGTWEEELAQANRALAQPYKRRTRPEAPKVPDKVLRRSRKPTGAPSPIPPVRKRRSVRPQ